MWNLSSFDYMTSFYIISWRCFPFCCILCKKISKLAQALRAGHLFWWLYDLENINRRKAVESSVHPVPYKVAFNSILQRCSHRVSCRMQGMERQWDMDICILERVVVVLFVDAITLKLQTLLRSLASLSWFIHRMLIWWWCIDTAEIHRHKQDTDFLFHLLNLDTGGTPSQKQAPGVTQADLKLPKHFNCVLRRAVVTAMTRQLVSEETWPELVL